MAAIPTTAPEIPLSLRLWGWSPEENGKLQVLGDSYFNHLANLSDLVLLMDESHRYRASAGVRSINELNPCSG